MISSGAYGFPKDLVLKIAITEIGAFLLRHEMTVFLVVYDRDSFVLSEKLFSSITQYIDDRYVHEHPYHRGPRLEENRRQIQYHSEVHELLESGPIQGKESKRSLEDVVNQLDETFSQMLLRLIHEKGFTDVEVYKRANIDRKLFSKIRNNMDYRPSKPTAIAFAIALRLNLDETKDLLHKAGFALSHSSKFDLIIEYFIEEANFNIFEINEALFAFDQNLLGL